MGTVDKRGKRAISRFVNQICSVDVDVSSAEGQCECLIGAIIVCLLFQILVQETVYCSLMSLHDLIRMGMKMKYVTRLE